MYDNTSTDAAAVSGWLTALVEELLDAQCDTLCLACADGSGDLSWAAHLDYLQGLQRVGQASLARCAAAA